MKAILYRRNGIFSLGFSEWGNAMTRHQAWKTVRTLACFVVITVCGVFTSQAATSAEPKVGLGIGFAYEPAKEITLVGTIKGFVSQSALATPLGLHLLINSGGKDVDAHLGPYLSKEDQGYLQTGQLVQIIGVNEKVHGKNVLLARQLIFNGRLVTVRNERGFLVCRPGSSRKIRNNALDLRNGDTK